MIQQRSPDFASLFSSPWKLFDKRPSWFWPHLSNRCLMITPKAFCTGSCFHWLLWYLLVNGIRQYFWADLLLSTSSRKEDPKWFVSVQNPVTPDRWRAGFWILWARARRVEKIWGSKWEYTNEDNNGVPTDGGPGYHISESKSEAFSFRFEEIEHASRYEHIYKWNKLQICPMSRAGPVFRMIF